MANVLVTCSWPVTTTNESAPVRVSGVPTERSQLNQMFERAVRPGLSTGEKNVLRLAQSVGWATSQVTPLLPTQRLSTGALQPGGSPPLPVITDWALLSSAW